MPPSPSLVLCVCMRVCSSVNLNKNVLCWRPFLAFLPFTRKSAPVSFWRLSYLQLAHLTLFILNFSSFFLRSVARPDPNLTTGSLQFNCETVSAHPLVCFAFLLHFFSMQLLFPPFSTLVIKLVSIVTIVGYFSLVLIRSNGQTIITWRRQFVTCRQSHQYQFAIAPLTHFARFSTSNRLPKQIAYNCFQSVLSTYHRLLFHHLFLFLHRFNFFHVNWIYFNFSLSIVFFLCSFFHLLVHLSRFLIISSVLGQVLIDFNYQQNHLKPHFSTVRLSLAQEKTK